MVENAIAASKAHVDFGLYGVLGDDTVSLTGRNIFNSYPPFFNGTQGSNGTFATLDYGDDGHATLFVGAQVTLEALDLQGGSSPSSEPAPEGQADGAPAGATKQRHE